MSTPQVLRLSFRGKIRTVQVQKDISFEDVINLSIEMFSIRDQSKDMLEFRDSFGNLCKIETFQEFIEKTPIDKRILYVTTPNGNDSVTSPPKKRSFVKRLKTNKFEKKRSTPIRATPVYRQNCFIGTLPASFVMGLQSPDPAVDKDQKKFKGLRM